MALRLRNITIIGMMILYAQSVLAAKIQYSAIVVDASNGRVLHSEEADALTYPASLTKMMTLYLLFEAISNKRISFQTLFRATAHATTQAPSKLGLKVGETISAHNAMLALIVKSANDVAVTVAENLAGSEANFAELMTAKARQLGMHSTTFKNASGLPHKHQKTTARDMVILGLALFKNFPQYYKYFKTTSFKYNNLTYNSYNKLVKKFDGCDGIKTGFINASGFNLVSSAKRNGRRYMVAVLGGDTAHARDRPSATLLELAFSSAHNTPFPLHDNGVKYACHDIGHNIDNENCAIQDLNHLVAKVDRNTKLHEDMDLAQDVQKNLDLMKKHVQQANFQDSRQAAKDNSKKTIVAKALTTPTNISNRLSATIIQVGTQGQLSNSESSWSIQLGSFSKADAAIALVKACRQKLKLPVKLKDSISLSSSSKRINKRLYRARLAGFNEKQATATCKFFKKIGQPCLVIEPYKKTKIYTAMNKS